MPISSASALPLFEELTVIHRVNNLVNSQSKAQPHHYCPLIRAGALVSRQGVWLLRSGIMMAKSFFQEVAEAIRASTKSIKFSLTGANGSPNREDGSVR